MEDLNQNSIQTESMVTEEIETTTCMMENIDDNNSNINNPVTIVGQMVTTPTMTSTVIETPNDTCMQPILPDQTAVLSQTLENKNDASMIQMNDSNVTPDSTQTIVNPVATSFIQVAAPSTIDNTNAPTIVHNNGGSIISASNINTSISQQIQLPIKISGSQPLFVSNPVIGSNVQTLGNTLTSQMCYLVPSNTLNKQTTVLQKGSTAINMTPTIVSNLTSTDGATPTTTLIANTGPSLITKNENDPSKCATSPLKIIQTNPRHLVFSQIKPSATTCVSVPVSNKPINAQTNNQISIKNIASKSSVTNTGGVNATMVNASEASKTTSYPALVANTNQQQQLIILSPVKTTNHNNKSQFIPSLKILPNAKLPNIAPAISSAASKRVIAPSQPTTKSTNNNNNISISNQPIQPTKNFQYINFVPFSSANQLSVAKNIPLKQTNTTTKQVTNTGSTTTKPNLVQVGQKVIVNPSSIKISGAATIGATSPTTGTTSSTGTPKKNSSASLWMVPKQNVKINDDSSSNSVSKKSAKLIPIPIAPNPNQANNNVQENQKVNVNSSSKNSQNNLEESRRKPCNCTRSQCLKLYCDCFANGEFCNNCNCVSCCNNLEHEERRQIAIRQCLERNPNAFHPKIGQSHQGDVERRHKKGCCCKRSGCLKNYCECYEAKILCSDKCKCLGCKNFEESTERKTLMHLADAAELRSVQQSIASRGHVWGPEFKSKLPVKVKADCHPFNVLNDEILEATANCLLAQAEEAEFENQGEENIEALIMEQFGECLSQILNLASNGMSDDDENSDDDDTMNDDD